MLALVSPAYLTRLWCRYEFLAYLVIHGPEPMFLGISEFLYAGCSDNTEGKRWAAETNWRLWERSIREGSTETAACELEADREYLIGLLHSDFVALDVMDDFLRFAAIALTARALLC